MQRSFDALLIAAKPLCCRLRVRSGPLASAGQREQCVSHTPEINDMTTEYHLISSVT